MEASVTSAITFLNSKSFATGFSTEGVYLIKYPATINAKMRTIIAKSK